MVDFRTKLFTLAGFATVFAGMAYGQATCSTASANAIFVRAEGNTEQVADTNITCTVAASAAAVLAGQTASVTVYLSPSVNITSAAISSSKNETTAGVTSTLPPVTAYNPGEFVSGTVSGNSVTFSNITLPAEAPGATFNLTITNIKIAASTVASGSGVPAGITETIFMSGTGIVPNVITPAPTVAFVTNGLANVKANKTGSNPICTQTSAVTNNDDGLSPPAPAADGINFSVAFTEGFADAFKIQGLSTTNVNLGSEFANHTETGWGTTPSNTATSGTRIKIIFNNIPANVSVYVPLTVSSVGGTLTLTASETGAFSPVVGSTAKGAPGAASDTTSPAVGTAGLLSVSSGSATAIYEATAATTGGVGSYSVPVYLEASAGAVTAPSGAITATVSFAPIGATSNVPNFINGSSTTTVNGSTFSACATTLMFPFVTNVAGFETGIAISNTSADLLSVSKGVPVDSVASQSGTCLLTFFANATAASNPAAFTTPSVAAGTTWASTLTSVTGGTPGTISDGYAIASCNFLYAHGYAFIVYNVGQASAMAEGYLALVVQTPRTLPPANETLNN